MEVAWGDLRELLGTDTAWSGVWDMQVTFADLTVKTYLEGDFIVYDDVTKP
jgi:hypothetical protein